MKNRRIGGLCLLLALLTINTLLAAESSPVITQAQNESVKNFKDGQLRVVNGISILTLKGSHYEMGLQYGTLLKDKLAQIMQDFDRFMLTLFKFPVPQFYYTSLGRKLIKKLPVKYQDELKGVAQACGFSYHKLVCIMHYHELSSIECASALVRMHEKLFHLRNLDYYPLFLGQYPLIIHYHVPGKQAYTLFAIAGYLPALTAINDQGITASVNAMQIDNGKKTSQMILGYKIREMMENAASLNDAALLLEDYATSVGWVLTLGSGREKKGTLFELANEDQVPHQLGQDRFKSVSNHFLSQHMIQKYQSIKTAGHARNLLRKQIMDQQLTEKADQVADLIRVISNSGLNDQTRIAGHDLNSINSAYTVHSLVLDPLDMRVYLAFSRGYSGWSRFFQYDLATGKLDFYQKADPKLGLGLKQSQWFEQAHTFYEAKEYAKIIAITNQNPGSITFTELIYLCRAWSKNKKLINADKLLLLADKIVKQIPQLAEVYHYQAFLFKETGQYQKAIDLLDQVLASDIRIYPYTKAIFYSILNQCYRKTRDFQKAKHYQHQMNELLRQYHQNWKTKQQVKKIL